MLIGLFWTTELHIVRCLYISFQLLVYSRFLLAKITYTLQKEKGEREEKALERWNTSKVEELNKKQKQKQKIAAKQRLEEEERQLKKKTAEVASEKWREERTQNLLAKHKEQKKKEKDETKKKEEEAREQVEASGLAFNAW